MLWALYSREIACWFTGGQVADWQTVGSWGDSFGALNAFFGAAAFAVVIATLIQQGNSIKNQRDDLYKERFDATFFQLLEMFRIAREQVRFRQSPEYASASSQQNPKIKKGLDAFRSAMTEFRYWLRQEGGADSVGRKENYAKIYKRRIHSRYESTFGPYFRLLYNILYRINNEKNLTDEEKSRYGNLVRGHMTSFEVGMAGFNALMEEAKDFNVLVTRFRLLKYYPQGYVRNTLEEVYPKEAFLGRGTNGAEIQLEIDPLDSSSDT